VAAWSFIVTYGILFLMNLIPGLSVRVDSESEIQGLDVAEIGEIAYDKSVHGSAQKLEA
jgi:Amt family ammonium transporter